MAPDLIVYGVVAAGLVFWLRSILGTRHGEERERPNPYSAESLEKAEEVAANITQEIKNVGESNKDRIRQLGLETKGIIAIENKTAENGLVQIAKADKNFDIDFFFEGAQEVFVMVIKAFAKGDRDTLKDLVEDNVFNAFEGAILDRERSGQSVDVDIHAIRKAEITKAYMDHETAKITVRFKAEETRVEKSSDGNILFGDPDKITNMIDVWTFSRDISKDDPRWLLVETASESDDDNDLVPDSI